MRHNKAPGPASESGGLALFLVGLLTPETNGSTIPACSFTDMGSHIEPGKQGRILDKFT